MKGMLKERLADPVLLAVFPRLDEDFSLDRVFFQLRREAFSRPDFHCKGRRKQVCLENGRKKAVRYRFEIGGKGFIEWEKKAGGRVLERAFCRCDQSYCVKTYRTSVFVSKIDYYTNSHQWSRTEFFRSPGEKELDAVISRDFLTDRITLRRDGKESALVPIPGLAFQNGPLLQHVCGCAGLPEAVLFSQKDAVGYCLETELKIFLQSIKGFYGEKPEVPDAGKQVPSSPPPVPVNPQPEPLEKEERPPAVKPRHAAPSPPTALVLRRARAVLQKVREQDHR